MIISGRLRDSAKIVLPGTALDDRGQVMHEDQIVARDVPVSVVGLYGQEFAQARQLFPTATSRVLMRADSSYKLTTKHILIVGDRRLNIGYINNMRNQGYELQLLCGEEQ